MVEVIIFVTTPSHECCWAGWPVWENVGLSNNGEFQWISYDHDRIEVLLTFPPWLLPVHFNHQKNRWMKICMFNYEPPMPTMLLWRRVKELICYGAFLGVPQIVYLASQWWGKLACGKRRTPGCCPRVSCSLVELTSNSPDLLNVLPYIFMGKWLRAELELLATQWPPWALTSLPMTLTGVR